MKFSTMLFLSVVICLFMIGGNIFFTLQKEHMEREIKVSKKRIIDAAVECYNDMACASFPITIETLIDNGYLENVINPITKDYYSEKSYVYNNGESYFIEEI